MKIKKIMWMFRAILYKLFFESVGWLSYIGKPIYLNHINHVVIGYKVRILPGLRMETYGSYGKIVIEDNVSIGQNFHIIAKDKELRIGKGTVISGNVFVSNVNHGYYEAGKMILKQEQQVKDTKIGENCFIGYGAVILPGTKLGKQCIVGANAVICGESFPDYSVIAGVPAKIIKNYNN